MSKFEDKVQKMNTGVLKVMQQDLQEKIARGKIGFGKRALNLLGSSLGVSAATTAINFGYAKDLKKKISDKTITDSHLKSAQKRGIVNAVISLGAVITSTVLMNKSSKRSNEKKLSFVDAELARRNEQEQSIGEPQRG